MIIPICLLFQTLIFSFFFQQIFIIGIFSILIFIQILFFDFELKKISEISKFENPDNFLDFKFFSSLKLTFVLLLINKKKKNKKQTFK